MSELGFVPSLVITTSDDVTSLISAFVDSVCTILPVLPGRDLPRSTLPTSTEFSVGFVDGRLVGHLLNVVEWLGLAQVYTTGLGRRPLASWHRVGVSVSHSTVGGITAAVSYISLYSRRPLPQPRPLVPRVPRDASTVLLATEFARGRRRAPKQRHVFPLRVVNLGSHGCAIYHGGGLLPATLSTVTRVLTPCLGLQDAEWGIRGLKIEEIWRALDISEHWFPLLPRLPSSTLHRLPPMLSLRAAFELLSGGGGG